MSGKTSGRVRGWVDLAQLYPVTAVLVAWAAAYALGAGGRLQLEPAPIAAIAALLLGQMAIAAFNDWCDRDADALAKPHKPLVRGDVSPRAARAFGLVCAAAVPLAAIPAGPVMVAWAVAGLLCGLSYDFGLKRTWLSPLPFLVALPGLLVSALWLGGHREGLGQLFLLGAPLALAVHLGNAAPDIGGDRVAGWRGLPQRLGGAVSFRLALAGIPVTLVLVAVFTGLHRPALWIPAAVIATAAGALAAMAWLGGRQVLAYRLVLVAQVIAALAALSAWL
ncbi:MAG: UbiA family prenyltransferase [Candidatus Dormibacteria bacterium]